MQLFYGPGSRHKPGIVAAEIDIPYNTLMRYIQGPTPCPAEILAGIFTVTKFEPIRQVLTPEGYQIVPLGKAEPDKTTLEGEILDDICKASRLCETYRDSISDGLIDEEEHTKLLGIMNELRTEVQETLQLLMRLKPMKVKLVKRAVS
jgi:hypothetical protein